jgi:hypothetical protein
MPNSLNAESSFKTYEELKEKFNRVVGQTIPTTEKHEKHDKQVERTTESKNEKADDVSTNEPNGSEDIFSGSDDSFFQNLDT